MAVLITIFFAISFMLPLQFIDVLAVHYQGALKIGIQHMENDPVDDVGLMVQLETQLDDVFKELSSGRAKNAESIINLKDWLIGFVKGMKTERDKYSKTINKSSIQLAEFAESLKADHDKNTKFVKEVRDQLMEDYNAVKELKFNLDKDLKTVKDLKSQLIHDAENVKELKSQLMHDAENVKDLKSQLIHDAENVKKLKSQLIHDVENVKELKSQLIHDFENIKELKSWVIHDAENVKELKSQLIHERQFVKELIEDTNYVNKFKTSYVENASNLTYQPLRDVDQVKHLQAESEGDPKVNRKLKFKFLQANKALKKLESHKTKDTRLKVQYEEETAKKPRFNYNEDIEFLRELEKLQIRQNSEFTNKADEKDSKMECKVIHHHCNEAFRNMKASESNFRKVTESVNLLYIQHTKNTQIISEIARQISQFQKENRKNTVMLDSHDVWLERILKEKHKDVQKLGTKIAAGNISESDFEWHTAHTVKRNTDIVPHTVVAFCAFMLDHVMANPSKGQPVLFDQVVTNEGDSYNKNSGFFTCKIGGIYVFSWNIDAITALLFKTALVKNGEIIGFEESGYSNQANTGSNMAVVRLDVGDHVWVKVIEGGAGYIDKFESSFAGFLLK